MPFIENVIRWVEETQGKITYAEWHRRKHADGAKEQQRQLEEEKILDAKVSERVNRVIFAHFQPELDGQMVPWNHVLIPDLGIKDEKTGKKIGKMTLRDAIVNTDIAHDGNIFSIEPKDMKRFPRVEDMTDEQILARLSQNLPSKPFYVETQKGDPRDPYYGLSRVDLKRME